MANIRKYLRMTIYEFILAARFLWLRGFYGYAVSMAKAVSMADAVSEFLVSWLRRFYAFGVSRFLGYAVSRFLGFTFLRCAVYMASPFQWLTLFLSFRFLWLRRFYAFGVSVASPFLGLAYAELKVNFVEGFAVHVLRTFQVS